MLKNICIFFLSEKRKRDNKKLFYIMKLLKNLLNKD